MVFMNLFIFWCTDKEKTHMKKPINFKLWNNLAGILTFLLSAFIYLSTLEPSVSFWDCGEFLSCATNLEVSHPPGAPVFMLLGRMAALLAGSDHSKIAIMVNGMAGIASALTIMFMFWTITWFGRKLLQMSWLESNSQKILILCSAFIGAMAYAVSDSFWFSAVEAEVYAYSSLFIALVFWCILKWEEASNKPNGDRWLMFIAYLIGLAAGLHLLNLLALPSIIVLYYLKNFSITWKNTIKAIAISIVILASILFGIIPGIPKFISWIEFLMVNSLGFPYNSGYLVGGTLIIIVIVLGLYFSYQRKKVWIYNTLVYVSLIIIGLSTYGVIVIRSNDNPPVDMSNPEDPFALGNYLNREQYGSRPLFYGPSFASPLVDTKDRLSYERSNGKYVSFPLNTPEMYYDNNTLMLFPRMPDNNPELVKAYKQWCDFKGKLYLRQTPDGKQEQILLPTFAENLTYFFRYQLGFMYFRYFMWNFVGRQNDIQGHGNVMNGNWISGIPIVDNARLGPQEKLPTSLKNNRGRNVYYFLPLLLGLIGLYYHYKNDLRNFIVLALLFFFTGIAITIFLNEIPSTPRERDYVSVASFYVFSIWIGIGVIALSQLLERWVKNKSVAITMAVVASISVPVLMGLQNWDNHDRSGRYHALEYSKNYLESCEPNAILFTNADNDTYPLWYAQEVEGIRRDIQIVLLPYLSANWYVHQMHSQKYFNQGLKMSLTDNKFVGGKRTYLPIVERIDSTIDLLAMLDFVGSEDPRSKIELNGRLSDVSNFIPSRRLVLSSNPKDAQPADSVININLKGSYLRMDQLVMLDIIATNRWERPVYFASVQEPMSLGLDKYLQLDGYAYKLISKKTDSQDYSDVGYIDTESLFNKLMNKFTYTSLANLKVYLDWTHITTVSVVGLRGKFVRLAGALLLEGKKEKAIAVLDKITNMLPNERIAFDYNVIGIADLYLRAGETSKGRELLKKLKVVTTENITYYQSMPKNLTGGVEYDYRVSMYLMQEIERLDGSVK